MTAIGYSSSTTPTTSTCSQNSCPQELADTSSSPPAPAPCKGWPSASTSTSFLPNKVPSSCYAEPPISPTLSNSPTPPQKSALWLSRSPRNSEAYPSPSIKPQPTSKPLTAA